MDKERYVLVEQEDAALLQENGNHVIHPFENGQYFVTQQVLKLLDDVPDKEKKPALYVPVSFPESQLFMDRHQSGIHLINDKVGTGLFGHAAYFVEEALYRNTVNAFKKEVEKTRDRILVLVDRNTPSRKIEFENYPADKYPIKFSLNFSHRDLGIAQRVKSALDTLDKEKARYRKTTNKYVRGATLHCYFRDVDSFTPIAEQLEGENLWKSTLIFEEDQLSPNDLIEQARTVVQGIG